jgi:hypothetical protein
MLTLPAGEHDLTVEFLTGQGAIIPQLTKNMTIYVNPDRRDNVYYISDQSVASQPTPIPQPDKTT